MMVAPIDDGYGDRRARQLMNGMQSAEARSDDDDMMGR
jgi:hypothetical protein